MADFKLITAYAEGQPMKTLSKATATVIEAWDMVALASGLAIKAVTASTAIAYSPNGAGSTTTSVQILNDEFAEFTGTGDAVFAVTDRGLTKDLVYSGTAQQIDVGTTSTAVFKVSVGTDAGVVDSASNIKVRINNFLY